LVAVLAERLARDMFLRDATSPVVLCDDTSADLAELPDLLA
jgi:hypothetical protein